MAREISAREAREKFADLIGRARFAKERTVVTSNGQPVAAVVSMEDLKLLEEVTAQRRSAIDAAIAAANEQYGPMLERLAK